MADTKLSALTALAVEMADADELYLNDGGVSKRQTYVVFKAAFVAVDGALPLTADWDAGSNKITAEQLASDIATGTAPLIVASTTVVTNLNADTVDAIQGAEIVQRDGSIPLTANWDVGTFTVTALKFTSDQATGTPPFTVASTTVVTNLNADTVDAVEGADIIQRDGSVPLTADWDVGAFKITGTQFVSDITTGTAPFVVASTTEVANLKAATATTAATVTGAAQTAITSVGTLTALQVDNININGSTFTATAASAEHGVGAVGTARAPVTTRWTENGVIVTRISFDLTGLYILGTSADEVIALEAGGAGFIGRNVVATNGVIFKAELSCIETATGSATITVDIDIATNTSALLINDGDAGAARIINGATLVIGQTLQNLQPALTANDYYYIVGADTAATTGTYTAGMYVLTTYGHAVLA